jgi:NAD+ kinase
MALDEAVPRALLQRTTRHHRHSAGPRGDARVRITLLVDEANARAREVAATLRARYRFVAEDRAEVGVVVGGDGFMLRTLHRLLDDGRRLPVYGLNLGTVGFLLNDLDADGVLERLAAAEPSELHPLRMHAQMLDGTQTVHLAVNEVSLLRASAQSARVRVTVDETVQIENLYGDGVLVATAAGSTAYNRSAGGQIIPLSARLLALTPIAGFRPRGWRGALLDAATAVGIEVVDLDKRPVQAAADHREVGTVRSVMIRQAEDVALTLLFDPHHTLEARILREQFR